MVEWVVGKKYTRRKTNAKLECDVTLVYMAKNMLVFEFDNGNAYTSDVKSESWTKLHQELFTLENE